MECLICGATQEKFINVSISGEYYIPVCATCGTTKVYDMTMVVKELIDTRAELAQARREFEDLKYRNGMVEDSLRDNLLEAQAENARLREALETCVWLTGRWAENYLVGSESHKGRYKLLEGNSRRALAGKEPEA